MSKDVVEQMYVSKEADYFSLERDIFKRSISGKGLMVLDVGCGTGVLGAYLKKEQGCTVYGIEINEAAFNYAKNNLDDVIHANVETVDLPYSNDQFDVVVMGDVLEHLVNPVSALKKIFEKVKPGGEILITVPNIRHWKIVRDLVFRDKWEYMSWGILDFTHLRFFTKRSIKQLLNDNQIHVKNASRVIQKPSISDKINKVSFGLFAGLLASHTFLVIKK